MSDPSRDADPIKDAWSEVADSFSALGRTMKERFDREPEPDERAARGADPTAALREAFEQLIAAGRDLGDKVTGVTRDDALKGQARQVGTSINQALEATINQITGEMRAFFKGAAPTSPGDSASEPVDATVTEEVDDGGGGGGPDDDRDPPASSTSGPW